MIHLLSINPKKCVGCSFCVNYNSSFFKIDTKNFKAKLKRRGKLVENLSVDLSTKQLGKIKKIINNCPTQAIKISK